MYAYLIRIKHVGDVDNAIYRNRYEERGRPGFYESYGGNYFCKNSTVEWNQENPLLVIALGQQSKWQKK